MSVGLLTLSVGVTEFANTIASVNVEEMDVQDVATYTAEDANENEDTDSTITTQIDADNVQVENNARGTKDMVTVTDLAEGTTVRVYPSETSIKVLGSGKVAKGETSVTINIPQLGEEAGKIYLAAQVSGKDPSQRTVVKFNEEVRTDTLKQGQVTVTNNVDTNDTVTVKELTEGDTIQVYNEKETKVLGKAKVAKGKTEVTINIKQIGSEQTKIKLTRLTAGKRESEKFEVTVAAETKTTKLEASNVEVVNTAGAKDTVTVKNLQAGDTIRVYNEDQGKVLGKTIVKKGADTAVLTITQIGTAETKIKVTVERAGTAESEPLEITVAAEAKTATLKEANVKAVNNAEAKDTVTVTGAKEGATIRVYNEAQDTVLGKATVKKGTDTAVVTIAQIGTAETKIKVTSQEVGKIESDALDVTVSAEAKTDKLSQDNVETVNNVGIKDTITVKNLKEDDIIKVYNEAQTEVLGTAIVKEDGVVVISLAQIGENETTVKLTVQSIGKSESDALEVTVAAEAQTDKLSADNVEIVNNVGNKDTITVKNLKTGDIVKVYNKDQSEVLGSAKAKETGDAIITIAQIGEAETTVKLTVQSTGKTESDALEVTVAAEAKTDKLSEDNIETVNNVGLKDTITVKNLKDSDIVKVYNEDQSEVLGTAKEDGNVVISLAQIGEAETTIKLTVQSVGKSESDALEVTVAAEAISTAIANDKVAIVNNIGGSDIVFAYGLAEGDLVQIYNAEGTVIGKATVAKGQSQVYITIKQLGEGSGKVSISVTSVGKNESEKKEFNFSAEASK